MIDRSVTYLNSKNYFCLNLFSLKHGSSPRRDSGRNLEYALFAPRHDCVARPYIGQHNDHVLREILGMSDEEITELVIDKALE